jgi:uncharacterized protein with PIN domain
MNAPRLFARLYLDEDVPVRVAEILQGHGYDVRTARDEDMLGTSDAEQLAFATENGLVLVTHNRTDFERLAVHYFEAGRTHEGIICAVRRPPGGCARRLMRLLNERTAEDFENQLLYV